MREFNYLVQDHSLERTQQLGEMCLKWGRRSGMAFMRNSNAAMLLHVVAITTMHL